MSRPRPSPTRVDTDRNLLLGLLALQNNFIDRGALLAAFAAWVADKSRTLGRVLLESGMVDADTHALLEAASDEDPSAPEMIDLRSIESTQIASSTAARSVMAGVDSSGTAAPVAVGSTDLATEMP